MRYFTIIARLLFSFGAFYYVLNKTDLSLVANEIRDVEPIYLISALLVYILAEAYSLSGLFRYLRSNKITIKRKVFLTYNLKRSFFDLFLPYTAFTQDHLFPVHAKSTHLKSVLNKEKWLNAIVVLFSLAIISFFIADFHRYSFHFLNLILILFIIQLLSKRNFDSLFHLFVKPILNVLIIYFLRFLSAFFILLAFRAYWQSGPFLFIFSVSFMLSLLPVGISGIGYRELLFLLGSTYFVLDLSVSVSISLTYFLISLTVTVSGYVYTLASSALINRKSRIPEMKYTGHLRIVKNYK
ncbi:MAG: hypothetical protein K9H64_07920 [Bacteroidales bacterium]|nr:hypothetical protein [Bacteroidales bacterium]MCF8455730.1 hypothetical protein [Bacteroidales bacterium]